MVAAIGTTANVNTGAVSNASPAALQSQLDRCSQQLGDWAGCSSGKTPEGQKVIQALEQKITELKAQLQTSGDTKSNAASSPSSGPASPSTSTASTAAQQAEATASLPPVLPSAVGLGSLGTLLNTVV